MLVSRRLFNTISFRLAALCALLFALILAVLLVFNYLATNHALEDQLRSRVMEDFNTFAEEVGGESGHELVKEFDERLTRSPAPGSFFYLADDKGDKLAGNLDHVPAITGWQKLPATAAGRPEFEHAHEIWGAGKTLPNGLFIFVGQDAFRVIVAQNTLIMSYLWSGLIAGLAALAAGILLSRGFLHRIDAINQTSLAIMQGNLKKRIPTRGTSDEVDRLSGNLNRLFDNNQALLDSLQQVTVNIAHDLRTPLSRLRNTLRRRAMQAAFRFACVSNWMARLQNQISCWPPSLLCSASRRLSLVREKRPSLRSIFLNWVNVCLPFIRPLQRMKARICLPTSYLKFPVSVTESCSSSSVSIWWKTPFATRRRALKSPCVFLHPPSWKWLIMARAYPLSSARRC